MPERTDFNIRSGRIVISRELLSCSRQDCTLSYLCTGSWRVVLLVQPDITMIRIRIA